MRASFRSRKRHSTRSTTYPTFTRIAQFSHSQEKQIAFGNTDPLIRHAAVTDFRAPWHDTSATYSNRIGSGTLLRVLDVYVDEISRLKGCMFGSWTK